MADITSTIGTNSRNYSTLQAWEDALPASAITAGNNYIAELYKDSEFSAAAPLVIAGCATDVTHTITVRAAAGQSFRDNANVRTNLLRYNAANGVGIKGSSGYNTTIDIQVGFVTLDGLQITHTNNGRAVICSAGTPPSVAINNCLCEAPGSFAQTIALTGSNGVVQNTAIINTGGGVGLVVQGAGGKIYGNTLVKTGAASSTGISLTGVSDVRNTVVANFSTCFAGATPANCSNNAATDATAPGTGSLQSLTLASLFEAPGTDYRTKAGSALIDAGTAIGPTTDISGTARPQGTAYDIGAWEVAAAGPVNATGTLASTLANATLATSGAVTNVGSFQATLGGASMSASGQVATPPSGSLASTLAGATMAASGQITIAGVFGSSLAGCTLAAAGAVNNRGSLASTLAGASMAASGTVAPNVSGTINTTLDGATMAAYGYNGVPPVLAGVFQRLPKNPRHVQKLP